MFNKKENMLGGFLDLNSESVGSFEQMKELLEGGRRLMITLPWSGKSHDITAEELKGDRVFIYNSLSGSTPTGQILGGQDGTPERRAEADGMESVTLDALAAMWKTGQIKVRALPSPA